MLYKCSHIEFLRECLRINRNELSNPKQFLLERQTSKGPLKARILGHCKNHILIHTEQHKNPSIHKIACVVEIGSTCKFQTWVNGSKYTYRIFQDNTQNSLPSNRPHPDGGFPQLGISSLHMFASYIKKDSSQH